MLRLRVPYGGRKKENTVPEGNSREFREPAGDCTQRYLLMKVKKMLSAVLASALLVGSVTPCFASTTQQKIDEAEKQKQEMESSLRGAG